MNCTYLDKEYETSEQTIRLHKQDRISADSLEEI